VADNRAAADNSRAVVAENREAADNNQRQANNAVRRGRDDSPADRHKAAAHTKTARHSQKRARPQSPRG